MQLFCSCNQIWLFKAPFQICLFHLKFSEKSFVKIGLLVFYFICNKGMSGLIHVASVIFFSIYKSTLHPISHCIYPCTFQHMTLLLKVSYFCLHTHKRNKSLQCFIKFCLYTDLILLFTCLGTWPKRLFYYDRMKKINKKSIHFVLCVLFHHHI